MVQSVAGGEGSVLSREPSPASDWLAHSWCCNCNIFPCSCYDINDSTFTRCRTRISHRLGPGGSTGPCCPSQSLVCMPGQAGQGRPGQQAGELSESRVWQAVSLLCPVSSLHTPHSLLPFKQTVQTSVVPQPHPGPGHCCLLYSAVSATASSLLALVQSRSFQTFEVYVMNVILRGSGIPYSKQHTY